MESEIQEIYDEFECLVLFLAALFFYSGWHWICGSVALILSIVLVEARRGQE